MEFFEDFTSNTCASGANQHIFLSKPGQVHTGRVFYKITEPGAWRYRFLFSNVIDSTYADGSVSCKNRICEEWTILEARVASCGREVLDCDFTEGEAADRVNREKLPFQRVLFNGEPCKKVAPGEFFTSDSVALAFSEGDYLCLELTFCGSVLPYHEESLLPVFRKTASGWVYDRRMPLPGMVGCDRPVEARIGYIGDSITQGIGTPRNSYLHWNAILSEKLGSRYAFWNLGIGYGRADDMASLGAWAFKAKHNDILIMCYGVNDILRGYSAERIIENLERIVDFFHREGKKIIVQTVPPFDYDREKTRVWQRVNTYIRQELSQKADHLFDVAPLLAKSPDEPQRAKFGGHPNEDGCRLWAEALYYDLTSQGILE